MTTARRCFRALAILLAISVGNTAHATQPDTAKVRNEIQPTLDGIMRAAKKQDGKAFVSYWDMLAFVDGCFKACGIPDDQRKDERKERAEKLKEPIGKAMVTQEIWKNIQIQRIEGTAKSNNAIVYVRHYAKGKSPIAISRIWMKKSAGKWRIYDLEDLDRNFRVSVMSASVIGPLLKGKEPPWFKSFPAVVLAGQSLRRSDLVRCKGLLNHIKNVKFPPRVEAVRSTYAAMLAYHSDQPYLAMHHLNIAVKNNPNMPVAWLYRANFQNEMGRYADALPNARKYAEILGKTVDGDVAIGTALTGLAKRTEAVKLLRQCVKDNPTNADALNALRAALPDKDKNESI